MGEWDTEWRACACLQGRGLRAIASVAWAAGGVDDIHAMDKFNCRRLRLSQLAGLAWMAQSLISPECEILKNFIEVNAWIVREPTATAVPLRASPALVRRAPQRRNSLTIIAIMQASRATHSTATA